MSVLKNILRKTARELAELRKKIEELTREFKEKYLRK